MRAWVTRNLQSLFLDVMQTSVGRQIVMGMLQVERGILSRGACDALAEELRDVEDDMRRGAEALAVIRVDRMDDVARTSGAGVAVTTARRALVDARTKLFHMLHPDADAADVHDALMRRGDA